VTLTIGVDIGGTKVAGGVVDENGTILVQHRVHTPARDAEATTDAIVSVIEAVRVDHDIDGVGLGIAGFVDASRSIVYFAPNLLGWRDGPLRDEVEKRVGLPVVVENDANAAAWGEARFGAGREAASLEQYASGRALVRDARERAAESRAEAEMLLGLGDGTPEGITGRHVTEAALHGDPVARAAFNALGHWVGQGLADLAAVLDPECFVLGGGVSEAGDLLLAPAAAAFEQLLTGRGRRPLAKVVLAQLGNDAGLVGAADLARYR